MKNLEESVLKTLAYADVFNYPLKKDEVWRFLISRTSQSEPKVLRMLSACPKISQKGDFYFLKGRKKNVNLRKKKEGWSQKKIKIAKKTARWFKIIPWVKMVGVSGALAMSNAHKDDDIDFLIIAQKNRLWLTRLLVVLATEALGKRRRPNDKQFKDKICLNMFLAEDELAISQKERDLFSAHEVVQLKPIWERNNSYQKFIRKNQWVKKYLANWKV